MQIFQGSSLPSQYRLTPNDWMICTIPIAQKTHPSKGVSQIYISAAWNLTCKEVSN